MSIIITIILVLLGIVALFFLVAFFVKKDYAIKRDIVINKPSAAVFEYIRHLKNQDYYSKWVMTDPNLKKEFRGTDGTLGFVYAWEGNKQAGKGEQEIVGIEGQRVDIELRFEKPFEAVGYTFLASETIAEQQAKVTWSMRGTSKYPMNFANLFIIGLLEKDLEVSLLNLKNILERS